MKWISRKTYAVYFYILFMVFMGMRYFDGLFLHQVSSNPIRSPRVDLIVWVTQMIRLPELFTIKWVAYLYDLAIFIIPCIILYKLYRNQKINKLVSLHVSLFGIYILVIYCFPTLSIRKYLGLVLIPIAFFWTSKDRYYSYLALMRYFVLFVFTSAALWKIFRGVALDTSHMQLSLKNQHIDNFVNWPDHYITNLLSTFIDDPVLCGILFLSAILLQLSFVVGFFTNKFDKVLAGFLILFIISDYLIMRIEYWEYIVFLPLFLNKLSKPYDL